MDKANTRNMKKRAEITSTQIVYITLLIVGFIVVVGFIYFIGFNSLIDRSTCHQSVILRGTLPSLGGVSEFVPMKCVAEKVCITTGLIGGKCEESFGKTSGIVKVKVSSKEEIEKYFAKEMIDCWSMMGEGKISVFSQWFAETYGLGQVYPTCVICSRISFDEKALNKSGINWTGIDVLNYMMRHKMPDSDLTYYQYFTGIGGKTSYKIDLNEFKTDVGKLSAEMQKKDKTSDSIAQGVKLDAALKTDLGFEDYKTPSNAPRDMAMMFMQISAPKQLGSLGNIAGTLGIGAGASFLTAPTLTGKLVGQAGKAILANPIIAGIALIAGIGIQQTDVYFNREATAGYCGDVSLGDEARDGCSAVRMITYDKDSITSYCSEIAGIS